MDRVFDMNDISADNKNSLIHYGWIILAVSVVTVLGSLGFGRFGYTMILPAMKTGLSLTESQAGDLATGNMIGYLILAVTCGFLSAHFSARKIITFFMLLLSVSMFITGFSPDFGTAFFGRVLAGIGSGGTNIPVLAIVIAWFDVSKRGLATGITVSGSSFGLLLTGLIIPAIISDGGLNGWRYSWFALGSGSLIIAFMCALLLRNNPEEKMLLPVGGQSASTNAVKNPGTLFQSFKIVYRSFTVWHLALIYVMYGFSYIIYATFFVRYLNWEGGFTLTEAGRLWSVIGALSIASGFIWGSISDRAGRKYGLFFVYSLQCACFLIFGLWKSSPGFYLSSFLFALTAWSIPAIMAAFAGDVLGPRTGSAALGFITLFFGIGQAAGPFAAGRIAGYFGSYTPAFVAAGIASFIGAVLSLLIRPHQKQ